MAYNVSVARMECIKILWLITLIKDIKYETGNGTMTNPYIINVENS